MTNFSTNYLNYLWNHKSFPEILSLKVFPDPKELTESVAGYLHLINELKVKQGDKNTLCYLVGDGSTPRTGVLFSKFSRWLSVSIDPAMKKNHQKINSLLKKTNRLETFSDIVENYKIPEHHYSFNTVMVVCIHSHANLNTTIEKLIIPHLKNNSQVGLITIPCCFSEDLKVSATRDFIDNNIFSNKNRVLVYNHQQLELLKNKKDYL